MAQELFAVDYVILVVVMAVTAAIGFYHAFTVRSKETTESLLLGNRRMHYIPLALSLMASYQSTDSALAGPYVVFRDGPIHVFSSVARTFAAPITAFVYLPVYHRLRVISIYEYLEIRFRKKIMKIIGTCSFILQTVNYLGIVLYIPSNALIAIIGFDLWSSALSIGIICTLYTALGGMKAVIWTDTFQAGIMIIGMLAILIQGVMEEGGINRVWKIAKEGGRTKPYTNFDLDPRAEASWWTISIIYIFNWLTLSGGSQVTMQRAFSASSLRNAQRAFLLAAPIFILWSILVNLMGLVLYSRFHNCNPVWTGAITNAQELLPIYVLGVLTNTGFGGLLLSIMFCAALSTFSSGLNSLAAVTLQDILKEFPKLSITDKRETLWLKLLVLAYGVFIVLYAGGLFRFTPVLVFASASIKWTLAAVLGLITLGMCFKQANWKGGLAGWSVGLIYHVWVGTGKFVVGPKAFSPRPPPATVTCLGNVALPAIEDIADSRNVFYELYRVDAHWQTFFVEIMVILIGILVSYCTGGEDQEKLNPKSVLNYREVFCPCRYKIDPEEDVPDETNQPKQKPVDSVSQYADQNPELWKLDNIIEQRFKKQSKKKSSDLTQVHSNRKLGSLEVLQENFDLEENDERSNESSITDYRGQSETLEHLPH